METYDIGNLRIELAKATITIARNEIQFFSRDLDRAEETVLAKIQTMNLAIAMLAGIRELIDAGPTEEEVADIRVTLWRYTNATEARESREAVQEFAPGF
jgi:hypothetical protein